MARRELSRRLSSGIKLADVIELGHERSGVQGRAERSARGDARWARVDPAPVELASSRCICWRLSLSSHLAAVLSHEHTR